MDHTVSEVASCRKKIEISYEPAEVETAFDESYDELRDGVTVKGFRRGRAPRRILERKFGKDVGKDVANKLVTRALEKVMEEDKINPMAEPALEPRAPVAEPGRAFAFSAEVDVRPEFALADYKGLALEEPSAEPTEKEILERLDVYRENFADRKDSEEPAARGDMLEVDAVVSAEDEDVLTLDAQWVKNDGDRLFDIACPELVEKLTGAAAGDSVRFAQAIPEDYPNPKLRGKEAKIVLRVKRVQRVTLPALDDAFGERLGCDSLAGLKERVGEQIRREKVEARHEKLQEQIIDQLVARMPFDLPAEFLERQTQSQMLQQWMTLARMGVSQDYLRENADGMKTETRERTERSVRWSIIADAIGEKEKIEITPEEVQEHINALAVREGATPAQVAQAIRDRQGGMYAVAAQLRDVKITTFLIDAADLKPADERSDEAKTREEKQKKD